MVNQQTCCICKLFYWCHSQCCMLFRWMINKSWERFCCPGCYCQGIVSEDRLGFCAFFARSSLDLQCQVKKMCETFRRVNEYSIVSPEVRSGNWSCNIFHYEDFFNKTFISIVKFKCCFANGLFNWPFAFRI